MSCNVIKSPASSSSPQKGNLTGARRLVNDRVVVLYNYIQKWNQFYVSGVKILQDLQSTGDADLFQQCCEKLGVTVESMNQQAMAMKECATKLASLCQLQNTSAPVFVSWNHQDFGNDYFG